MAIELYPDNQDFIELNDEDVYPWTPDMPADTYPDHGAPNVQSNPFQGIGSDIYNIFQILLTSIIYKLEFRVVNIGDDMDGPYTSLRSVRIEETGQFISNPDVPVVFPGPDAFWRMADLTPEYIQTPSPLNDIAYNPTTYPGGFRWAPYYLEDYYKLADVQLLPATQISGRRYFQDAFGYYESTLSTAETKIVYERIYLKSVTYTLFYWPETQHLSSMPTAFLPVMIGFELLTFLLMGTSPPPSRRKRS